MKSSSSACSCAPASCANEKVEGAAVGVCGEVESEGGAGAGAGAGARPDSTCGLMDQECAEVGDALVMAVRLVLGQVVEVAVTAFRLN